MFNTKKLIHALLPIRYDSYWFITQYIGLYIISPFLSKWARSMSKKEYKTMLVSFFCYNFHHTVTGIERRVQPYLVYFSIYVCRIHATAWGEYKQHHTKMETTCRNCIHIGLIPVVYDEFPRKWKQTEHSELFGILQRTFIVYRIRFSFLVFSENKRIQCCQDYFQVISLYVRSVSYP